MVVRVRVWRETFLVSGLLVSADGDWGWVGCGAVVNGGRR